MDSKGKISSLSSSSSLDATVSELNQQSDKQIVADELMKEKEVDNQIINDQVEQQKDEVQIENNETNENKKEEDSHMHLRREKDNEDEEIATESSLTKRMNIDESLTKEQDKLVSASSDGAISSSDNRALEWRIMTTETTSGKYIWDVYRVQFIDTYGNVLNVKQWIDSNHYSDDFKPSNVDGNLNDNKHSYNPWGGRRDKDTEELYIGAVFNQPATISLVRIVQGFNHRALFIHVQKKGNDWETVKTVKNCENLQEFTIEVNPLDDSDAERAHIEHCCKSLKSTQYVEQIQSLIEMGFDFDIDILKETLEETGGNIEQAINHLSSRKASDDKQSELESLTIDDFVTPPSTFPVSIIPHDVSLKSRLHPPRETEFVPSESFYNSVCIDGLWICTSKSVEQSVLDSAVALISKVIPIEQRKLWGKFRSPLWAKDPGPMRIIILDDRTDEQAGVIPELQDGSKGRNGTSCPFVFTSREDFVKGIGDGSWPMGKLTMHESTHGADMVIRQLIDPYFNDIVNDLYKNKKAVYKTKSGRKMYAASHRDEYLAECLTIALNLVETDDSSDYKKAGLSCFDDLINKDPAIVELLSKHFNISLQ